MSDGPESPRFDLTTANGLRAVERFFGSPLVLVLFPAGYLAAKLFNHLAGASEVSPERQAQAAEKIIDAARRNGARRVRFKVDKSVGAKLKGNVKADAVVEALIGVDGKMELEIEF